MGARRDGKSGKWNTLRESCKTLPVRQVRQDYWLYASQKYQTWVSTILQSGALVRCSGSFVTGWMKLLLCTLCGYRVWPLTVPAPRMLFLLLKLNSRSLFNVCGFYPFFSPLFFYHYFFIFGVFGVIHNHPISSPLVHRGPFNISFLHPLISPLITFVWLCVLGCFLYFPPPLPFLVKERMRLEREEATRLIEEETEVRYSSSAGPETCYCTPDLLKGTLFPNLNLSRRDCLIREHPQWCKQLPQG